MKRRLLKYGSIVAAIAFLAVFYGLAIHNTPGTEAVKATDFNPGRIIDDAIFYNPDTMTVEEIQAFLDAKLPTCDMWGTGSSAGRVVNETGYVMPAGSTNADYARLRAAAGNSRYHEPPYVCVNKYYENPETHETLYETKGIVKDGMISAAQIIYNEAHKYNINPQVLLVLLKKESYVWGDTWPLKWEYNSAMGYGCPDTAPCDTTYYGFYNQVHMAAYQFDRYKQKNYEYNYHPGMINNIYYSPNYSCGTKQVYIENMATASLYIYTPYTPNDAALANYPGESYCGSYGNRNFFMYFSEWFGSTYTNNQLTAKERGYSDINKYYNTIGGENSYLGKKVGDMICDLVNDGCKQEYEVGYIYWSPESGAWDVSGRIGDRWQEIEAENSALGYPVNTEGKNLLNGGAYQKFQNGRIYYTKATGAWEISGAIYDEWFKQGTEWGKLGYPTGEITKIDKDISYQQFEHGIIFNSKNATISISDWAKESYLEFGGYEKLGAPIAAENCTIANNGCFQKYENGRIYWTEKTGAHILLNDNIYGEWFKQGTEWGKLGYPTGEKVTFGEVASFQEFENGIIFETKNGLFTINEWGRDAFVNFGGYEKLGAPIAAENCTIANNGCFQKYSDGRIYWTKKTGAQVMTYGDIYSEWFKQGTEWGKLGYPISEEKSDSDGNIYQIFEHGRIYSTTKGIFIVGDWALARYNNPLVNEKIGLPISNENCSLINSGCFQKYENGRIYWTEKTGSWEIIYGPIYDEWFKQGTEWGKLGYPISEEKTSSSGGVYQDFEHGRISK